MALILNSFGPPKYPGPTLKRSFVLLLKNGLFWLKGVVGVANKVKDEKRQIIIFDGVCNLCNGSVNFIIARDVRETFMFSPVQSAFAISLLKDHNLTGIGKDSFVLVKEGKCYLRSDAALQISKQLPGLWPVLSGLRIIPRPLRDMIYNLVARNRYKLFGKKDSCMVPTPELQRRFIFDPE